MDTITLTIDGIEIKTTKGKRILEAALDAGIYIPNLCALRDIKLPFGACRLCQVQIEGRRGTVTACSEPAADGMVVSSDTPEINNMRRKILQIMLARHPHTCLTCHRRERCRPGDICLRLVDITEEQCVLCPNNGHCEVQKVVDFIGLDEMPFPYTSKGLPIERDNPYIIRNNNLCILCGRCVMVCQEILGIEAIAFNRRGPQTFISGAFGKSLADSGCTFCGSCVEVCPTGALVDRDDTLKHGPDREAASIRCKDTCPVGVDVPRFIRFIREGKYAEATAVIQEKVPFAAICSLICAHPCEDSCRRGDLDQPVSIRGLERFVIERFKAAEFAEGPKAAVSGKKVAIVGSGPTGLTAAYYLAKKCGHAVTIFESLPQLGGIMRAVIPEYSLPRDVLDAEIEGLNKLDIEMRTRSEVESPDKLFKEGYDAVLLAIGAQGGAKLDIKGEDATGVMDGLSFLRQVNAGENVKVGEKIAVVGDGAIAVYVARAALRLGSKSVTIVSSTSQSQLSVPSDEIAEALGEGIELKPRILPSGIVGIGNKLKLEGIPVTQERLEIDGSTFTIDVDNIIVAVGGTPDVPEQFGLTVKGESEIVVDPSSLATSKKGVFAAGGVVTEVSSFIEAVAAGRKAAISVDKYLGGGGNIDEVLAPVAEGIPRVGRIENFAQRQRKEMPSVAPSECVRSFAQVELGFTDEMGSEEAMRCMGCDLRFAVSRMVDNPAPRAIEIARHH